MTNQAQRDIVLAGLSAAGQNANFSPVQVQKLFFIIDREISNFTNGPFFNFEPYDYGPFDKAVYEVMGILSHEGMVEINNIGRYNRYSLTSLGFEEGQKKLNDIPKPAQNFIIDTVSWIKSLSFEALVSSIYKKYPDMKENSIFKT